MVVSRAAAMLEVTATRKSWWFFVILFALAWIVSASLNGNWAVAIGSTSFSGLIGGALIYRAKTVNGLLIGYAVFAVLLAFWISNDVSDTVTKMKDGVAKGCLRNTLVATLPTQEQKTRYCGCIGNEVRWRMTYEAAIANLMWQTADTVLKKPSVVSAMSAASATCAREL